MGNTERTIKVSVISFITFMLLYGIYYTTDIINFFSISPYHLHEPAITYNKQIEEDYEFIGSFPVVDENIQYLNFTMGGKRADIGFVHQLLIQLDEDTVYCYENTTNDYMVAESYSEELYNYIETNMIYPLFDVYINKNATEEDLYWDRDKPYYLNTDYFPDTNWNVLITQKGQSLEDRLNDMYQNYLSIEEAGRADDIKILSNYLVIRSIITTMLVTFYIVLLIYYGISKKRNKPIENLKGKINLDKDR